MKEFNKADVETFLKLTFKGVKTSDMYGATFVVSTKNCFATLVLLQEIKKNAEEIFKKEVIDVTVSPNYVTPHELVYSICFKDKL